MMLKSQSAEVRHPGGYTQHGIYVGADKVVHYAGMRDRPTADLRRFQSLIDRYSPLKQTVGAGAQDAALRSRVR
jgi:hypothetical protein